MADPVKLLGLLFSAFPLLCSCFEPDALPGWLGETHKSNSVASLKEPPVIRLSWKPRAFLYRGFLSEEECDHVIKISTPTMQRSTVVDPESKQSVVDDYRSSSGTFIMKAQDPVIATIEKRIASWTFLPVENQEAMQVLRYGIGQKYESHHDFFDEDDKQNMQGGHRYATVLMYLSNVYKGGETVFPDSEPDRREKDESWTDCGKRGIATKPKKGDALLFFSLHPNATTDVTSLHAGCPVVQGEKWSATKWIHVRSFDLEDPASSSGACVDEDIACEGWAKEGECKNNAKYMMSSCRRACKACGPDTASAR